MWFLAAQKDSLWVHDFAEKNPTEWLITSLEDINMSLNKDSMDCWKLWPYTSLLDALT